MIRFFLKSYFGCEKNVVLALLTTLLSAVISNSTSVLNPVKFFWFFIKKKATCVLPSFGKKEDFCIRKRQSRQIKNKK